MAARRPAGYEMEWLRSLYPAVEEAVAAAAPPEWIELRTLLIRGPEAPVLPEMALPLAACRAAGGCAQDAVPIAAALMAGVASLRTLDDLGDQDRPGQLWQQVGPARAWNFAAAMQAAAFRLVAASALPADLANRVSQLLAETFMGVMEGQDRAFKERPRNVAEYWETLEMRSGRAYAGACALGAVVAGGAPGVIGAVTQYGRHLGLAMHVLNDIESIWSEDTGNDLEHGRITLPLLYGLELDHAGSAELAALCRDGVSLHASRIGALLAEMGVRDFMVWTALRERESALSALEPCPGPEGVAALAAFVTALFGDLEHLTGAREGRL